jgi:hypothetical protein
MVLPVRRPRWLLLAACCQAALCMRAFPPLRRTQPPLMTLLSPEGRARAALARPSGVGLEPVLLKTQQSKSLPKRLKDAAIVSVVKASERLWQDVFNECDVDNDDSITRRELLVLMKRLDLEIPNEEELSRLISESDIDEAHAPLPCLPTCLSCSYLPTRTPPRPAGRQPQLHRVHHAHQEARRLSDGRRRGLPRGRASLSRPVVRQGEARRRALARRLRSARPLPARRHDRRLRAAAGLRAAREPQARHGQDPPTNAQVR